MAGFGIAGFLGAGRGPALPESGAVLVAGSGDRYVVVDGRLHPALNLASALLVGGGSVAQVRPVALDALPRGLPVGIPEAPDALPAPERLSTAPWTVCAVPSGAATLPPEVTVRVAAPNRPPGPSTPGRPCSPPARTARGGWSTRAGVTGSPTRPRSGSGCSGPRRSRCRPRSWTCCPRARRSRRRTSQAGCPGGRGAAAWVAADVVRVQAGGTARESLAVLPDGVAPVSELTAALLVSAGSNEVATDPATAATARRSRTPSLDTPGWPEVIPQPVGPQRDQPLCLSTTPGAPAGDAPWPVRVSLPGVVLGPGEQAVHTGQGDTPGVVDQVMVPRGAGALVRATTASGGDGALTLVTDSGQRFAVPTPDAATRLRYDPAAARSVPAPFVRLLPAGPALDPEAAAREFTGR